MSGDIKKILTRYIEDERKNVANDKKCMENIDKLEKEDQEKRGLEISLSVEEKRKTNSYFLYEYY